MPYWWSHSRSDVIDQLPPFGSRCCTESCLNMAFIPFQSPPCLQPACRLNLILWYQLQLHNIYLTRRYVCYISEIKAEKEDQHHEIKHLTQSCRLMMLSGQCSVWNFDITWAQFWPLCLQVHLPCLGLKKQFPSTIQCKFIRIKMSLNNFKLFASEPIELCSKYQPKISSITISSPLKYDFYHKTQVIWWWVCVCNQLVSVGAENIYYKPHD